MRMTIKKSWQQLVVGLTPPGYPYEPRGVADARIRSVLWALAWFADEQGRCKVSYPDIQAVTHLQREHVRFGVRELQEQGFISYSQSGGETTTYRLLRDVLEARQYEAQVHEQDSLEQLKGYGLSRRAINALHTPSRDYRRRGMTYQTVGDLAAAVEAYRWLPVEKQQEGFYRFLNIPNLGEGLANDILAAYDAWKADQA